MKRPLSVGFLAALLLVIAPLQAQPLPDYPTAIGLEQTAIPVRDRVDLAQRLLGVTEIPPPALSPPDWQLGDRQLFWASNPGADTSFQVEASLEAVGEHLAVWVQHDVSINPAILSELVAKFDSDIYPTLRDLWGSEDTPGIDGDSRVYALFAYGLGPGIAAYFSSTNTFPQTVVTNSNEHEMIYFNLDTIGTIVDADTLVGLSAHEFQHMIREHQDSNETTWMDEGFSTFTEFYSGYPYGTWGQAFSFLSVPSTQLNTWSENGPRQPHYGAAMLLITYFYERFGEAGLRALSLDPDTGLQSVDHVIRQLGEGDEQGVNEFIADWVLANYLQDPLIGDGRYGYRAIAGLSSAIAEDILTEYPHLRTDTANQYSTDYVILKNLDDAQTLNLTLTMPQTVQLVPVDAYSGQWMWYSNRQDESDTRLTHAFDLTGVTSATLNYQVWYHIEALWDYGYVMVSTDEGQTWDVLETPNTTRENPQGNAYGPGYTGSSDGWLAQSVSLDAYAGQEILVRFEVITDEAVTQHGMVIDDVSIPEIGYTADFEADSGGWIAEGWVWIDNVLPQQTWVQAVQQIGDTVQIIRWQGPAAEGWTLPLSPGVDQVVLAISPFAPLTTLPMPYTLNITAQ